jgi:hypothetical protein
MGGGKDKGRHRVGIDGDPGGDQGEEYEPDLNQHYSQHQNQHQQARNSRKRHREEEETDPGECPLCYASASDLQGKTSSRLLIGPKYSGVLELWMR